MRRAVVVLCLILPVLACRQTPRVTGSKEIPAATPWWW
jgi:hypothetical protein